MTLENLCSIASSQKGLVSLIVPIWIRLLLSYRTKSRSIVISVPADRCVNMERQSDREAGRQVLAHPLQGLA